VLADAHNTKVRTLTAPPQSSLVNILKMKKLYKILNESDYRALVYSIEFPDIKSPWHAATVYVHHRGECAHDAVAKMLVPWTKEERVAFIR